MLDAKRQVGGSQRCGQRQPGCLRRALVLGLTAGPGHFRQYRDHGDCCSQHARQGTLQAGRSARAACQQANAASSCAQHCCLASVRRDLPVLAQRASAARPAGTNCQGNRASPSIIGFLVGLGLAGDGLEGMVA